MRKKTPKQITIELEYAQKPELTKKQIEALKLRLKCAVVLAFPEQVRREAIRISDIFGRSRK
jgi:hypothetical protein